MADAAAALDDAAFGRNAADGFDARDVRTAIRQGVLLLLQVGTFLPDQDGAVGFCGDTLLTRAGAAAPGGEAAFSWGRTGARCDVAGCAEVVDIFLDQVFAHWRVVPKELQDDRLFELLSSCLDVREQSGVFMALFDGDSSWPSRVQG